MYTVFVVAADPLREQLTETIKTLNGAIVNGSSTSLRQALNDAAGDAPGVMLVDDRLIAELPALADQLNRCPFPLVLLADEAQAADAARRALMIRARDLVWISRWAVDLPVLLPQTAQPLIGSDHEGRIITVFSSKGGVGKSTVALNTALAFAKITGKAVALLDWDFEFGDLATMIGVVPRVTILDVIQSHPVDNAKLERALIAIPDTRVHLLAAPTDPRGAEEMDPGNGVRILQLLRKSFDWVLIDLPPGYSDMNVAALDFCDMVLAVCSPDVIAARTMAQVLSLFAEGFQYPAEKVRLVLNRSGSLTGIDAADIAQVLSKPIAFHLPSGGVLPVKASNQGVPLLRYAPKSNLALAILDMARQIVEEAFGPMRTAKSRAVEPKVRGLTRWTARLTGSK